MSCRDKLAILGIICLLFVGIPIRINKEPSDDETLFQKFVLEHNKPYINNATEYSQRLSIFLESLRKIQDLNKNRTEGSALYGITPFCDMTSEEFVTIHLSKTNRTRLKSGPTRVTRALSSEVPEKFDWRKRGVITPVRNQLTCGACWAFSTVETVETMNALKNRSLTVFSVQQIIDCAKNGNNGCEGGDSRLVLEWLLSSKTKIVPDQTYPYDHAFNTCKTNGTQDGIQITNFTCKSFVGVEEGIQELLAFHGPVAVAVNAANWQYYLGGVIQYHCSGSASSLNHAVQIVGYVTSATTPYFIARNSWGSEFGDDGYLYLAIGKNICGLATEVCALDVL